MKAYCTSIAFALTVALAAGGALAKATLDWDPVTRSPMVTTTGANLVVPYRATVGSAPLDRVELLVSTNMGRTWKMAGYSSAPTGRITYLARRPGIYWFITRARDRLGHAEPKPYEGIRPELIYKVIPSPPTPPPPVVESAHATPVAPEPVPHVPTTLPATREALDPVSEPTATLPLATACDVQTLPQVEPKPTDTGPRPGTDSKTSDEVEDPYASDPDDPATVVPHVHLVRERTCHISYQIPGARQIGLASVELYYTQDKGFTWTRSGPDPDRKTPATFIAPGEGTYGFYLVFRLLDQTGNKPPRTGTAPQKWALVDYTPPLLQILTPKDAQVIRERQPVRIEWAAFDARPVERPISIRYRRANEAEWTPIAPAIEDTGEYMWKPPTSLAGAIILSVAAMDKTSNQTFREVTLRLEGKKLLPETRATVGETAQSEPEHQPAVEVRRPTPPPAISEASDTKPVVPAPTTRPVGAADAILSAAPDVPAPPPVRAVLPPAVAAGQADDPKQKAVAAYSRATLLRARQKLTEAEAAFREAIALDPGFADAYNDLACLLLPQGRSKEAIAAFNRALKAAPNNGNAMYGLAMAQLQSQQLSSAAETLGKLVALRPTDAEAWLHLGDVMYYRQKLADARRCWEKARRYAASGRVSTAATGRLQQFR